MIRSGIFRIPPALRRGVWLAGTGLALIGATGTALAQDQNGSVLPEVSDIAAQMQRLQALPALSPGFSAAPRPEIRDRFERLTRHQAKWRLFTFPLALTPLRRNQLDKTILPPLPGADPRQSATRQTNGGNLSLGYTQPWLEGQLLMTANLEPSSEGFATRYANPTERRDLVGRDSLKLGSGLQFKQSLADNFDIDLKASLRQEITDQTTRQDSERLWLFNEGSSAMISDVSGTAQWQGPQGLHMSFGGQSSQSERYTHSFVTADDQLITVTPLQRIDEARSDVFLASQLQPLQKVEVNATVSLINQSLNQTTNSGALERALGRKITYVRPDVKVKWRALQKLAIWFGLKDEMKPLGYEDLLRPDAPPQAAVLPERHWTGAVNLTYPIAQDSLPIDGEFTFSAERSMIENTIDHTVMIQGDSYVDIRGNIGTAQTQDLSARLSLKGTPFIRKDGDGGKLLDNALANTSLEMQATWRQSSVRDPVSLGPRPMSGQTPLSLSLNFQQTLKAEGLSWGVRADNGWKNTTWRSREISISRSGPRVNLFAEYSPLAGVLEGLKLRAEVNNLTHQTQSYERLVYDDLRSSPDARIAQSQWSQAAEPFVVLRLSKVL